MADFKNDEAERNLKCGPPQSLARTMDCHCFQSDYQLFLSVPSSLQPSLSLFKRHTLPIPPSHTNRHTLYPPSHTHSLYPSLTHTHTHTLYPPSHTHTHSLSSLTQTLPLPQTHSLPTSHLNSQPAVCKVFPHIIFDLFGPNPFVPFGQKSFYSFPPGFRGISA